jgi:sugar (pentulose or hexulose) kinase
LNTGTIPGARLPAERTAPLGNRPSPGMAGPILRWLTRHEPRTVERARWALPPKDRFRLRLTGVAVLLTLGTGGQWVVPAGSFPDLRRSSPTT